MLHFYTYIYPFVFFFSFQKRLANLFLLLHPETDFFFGRISKWLKGADCKSVRIFLSGVRIPLLPPGWAVYRWCVAAGRFGCFGVFCVFCFFRSLWWVFVCFFRSETFQRFVHKKTPATGGCFFRVGMFRTIV